MKHAHNILCIAAAFIFLVACKDKNEIPVEQPQTNPQIEIALQPFYATQPLVLDQTVFTTEEGYKVKLRELKIILTDIRSTSALLASDALYNFETSTSLLKTNGTSAQFGNLAINIGVPQTLNHSDPSAFPNNSALNIVNANDMHWSWNPGYIFFKIELIADTLNDGLDQFNHVVSYHVGKDECFQTVQLNNLTWNQVGNNVEQLKLKLDLKTVLRNGTSIVDIKTENGTHSAPDQMPLSQKLAENFKNAITAL